MPVVTNYKFSDPSELPARIRRKIQFPEGPEGDVVNGCWNWLACISKVPTCRYKNRIRPARRVVFEILSRYALDEYEPLHNKCGNPLCVNPTHTQIGTNRNSTPTTAPRYDQAARICRKFGGEITVARLLNLAPSTCYRWSYPPPKGTDGLIPTKYVKKLREISRFYGVLLTNEDFRPSAVEDRLRRKRGENDDEEAQ